MGAAIPVHNQKTAMKLPEAIQQAQAQATQTGEAQHVVLRAEYEPQAPGAHAEWQVFTDSELAERGITSMMIARTFGSASRGGPSAPRIDDEDRDDTPSRPVRGTRTRTVRRTAPPPPQAD